MPDYADVDPEEAVRDFRARIAHYEKVYETIDDSDGSYIKIIDVGGKIVLHRIGAYLPGRVVPLLINLHVTPRPIWLTRHGESAFNVLGIIGGDADLSPRGGEYAESLARFVREDPRPGAGHRVDLHPPPHDADRAPPGRPRHRLPGPRRDRRRRLRRDDLRADPRADAGRRTPPARPTSSATATPAASPTRTSSSASTPSSSRSSSQHNPSSSSATRPSSAPSTPT